MPCEGARLHLITYIFTFRRSPKTLPDRNYRNRTQFSFNPASIQFNRKQVFSSLKERSTFVNMRFIRIIAAFALPVVSMALSVDASAAATGRPCAVHLSPDKAGMIVTNFISILSHENLTQAKVTAEGLLADNFTEVSDSILSLEGLPVSLLVQHACFQPFLPLLSPIIMLHVLQPTNNRVLQQLNATTFADKQDYIKGVLNAPPLQGIETLAVYPITGTDNVNRILWQWKFTGVGTKIFPVKGFNLFTLNDAMQIGEN